MTDEKKPEAELVVARPGGLQVVQELKIGTQDITYIGVARHEAQLIQTGNEVAEKLTKAQAKVDKLKEELSRALLARARTQYGLRLDALVASMRDIGFDVKKPEIALTDSVDALFGVEGEEPVTSVGVELKITEGTSTRYSSSSFEADVKMDLVDEDRQRIAACLAHREYIRRLMAAANQVKKARQELGTYERQMAAALAEANLKQSDSGKEALRVIDAMPKFTLGVSIEEPAIVAG